jgi:hypothetical protein
VIRFVPLGALVVALAVPSVGASATSSPQTEVRAVLLHQVRLFKQQRWRALYRTTTPRMRASCPYATYARVQRRNYQVLGSDFQVRNIRVRIETRTRAIVAYDFVKNGRLIARATFRDRDVYARVNGRWLDELDRVSGC